MKNSFSTIFIIFMGTRLFSASAQDSISDYDGNFYHPVAIGAQVWLKENIKALHYSDGTEIPEVAVYDNSDSLGAIYGRLYTWDAAMKNSISGGTQGVCPPGWHVPTDMEFTTLENFLGGYLVAGGKLKDTTSGFWNPPNKGADNSSGFTALPAGEYDAYYNPHQFRLLHEYAVFWTSTQVTATKAKERFLAYDTAACLPYNWFKVMKYSVRCLRDIGVGANENEPDDQIRILNPVNSNLIIMNPAKAVIERVEIIDMQHHCVKILNENQDSSIIDVSDLKAGTYIVLLFVSKKISIQKIIKASL